MSRRWRYPRLARGKYQQVTAPSPELLSWYAGQAGWRPLWPQIKPREGRFFDSAWPQNAPPEVPAFVPALTVQAGRKFRAGGRRARFTAVLPEQVAQAPSWTPSPVRARPRWVLSARRGEFRGVAAPQDAPPPNLTRARARLVLPPRRGSFAAPPRPSLGPAPLVPSLIRNSRRWTVRWRPGGFFDLSASLAPQAVPAQARTRPRTATRPRSGRWFTAPPQAPWTPPVAGRARVRAGATRRAEFIPAPVQVAPAQAPTWLPFLGRVRPRFGLPARAGFLPVVPEPVVPAAPAFPPPVTRSRVRAAAVRRSAFLRLPPSPISPVPPEWVPPLTRAAHPDPVVVRRGRYGTPPPEPGGRPPSGVSPVRRARIAGPRRGVFFGRPVPVPVQVPVPLPCVRRPRGGPVPGRRGRMWTPPRTITAVVPQMVAARRPRPLHAARGSRCEGWLIGTGTPYIPAPAVLTSSSADVVAVATAATSLVSVTARSDRLVDLKGGS